MNLKKSLSSLKPYVAGKPLSSKEYLKLNANECPFALPQSVYKKACKIKDIHRYHEGSGYLLRSQIASSTHLLPQNIILGNGSGELILLYLLAFLEPEQEIVISEGTFSLYKMYGLLNNNKVKTIPLNTHLQVDLEAMQKAIHSNTKVVFLCNPNNPTGHSWSYEKIEEFLKALPPSVTLFLDEAYIHYSPYYNNEKIKDFILKYKNLFVLRTFSKLGLAGVRCGYGMAQEGVISLLHQVRAPFNVNSYALVQASALLEEKKYLKYICQENFKQLHFLSLSLSQLGFKTYPSTANFILVKGPLNLDKDLENKKVLIRSAQSFGFSADYYRITIGTHKENQILLKRLKEG